MSVQVTITLTEAQAEFAGGLVADGQYPSLDVLVQERLDLLREEAEARPWEEDKEAFRAFIEERLRGPFISMEEGRRETEAMLERLRAEYGVSG